MGTEWRELAIWEEPPAGHADITVGPHTQMSDQPAVALQSEYGINPAYHSADSSDRDNSWYGKGNYPPDWDRRRDAVWARQNYWCGRCQTYKGDASQNACHHVQPLSKGGSNHPDNLVGLCGACHSIMPPESADAGPTPAIDTFPDPDSDLRVATVYKGGVSPHLDHDLQALAGQTCQVTHNEWSVRSSVCYDIPAVHARNLHTGNHLATALRDRDIVPRTQPHNQLHINYAFTGIKALFTTATPLIGSWGDTEYEEAIVNQSDSNRNGYESVITTTPVADLEMTVGIQQTDTEVALDPPVTQQVSFSPKSRTQAVEFTLPAPPLTRDTAVDYLGGLVQQILTKIGILGVILLGLTEFTALDRGLLTYLGLGVVTVVWIGVSIARAAASSAGATVSEIDR